MADIVAGFSFTTERVKQIYDNLWKLMTCKQEWWGEDLTILNEVDPTKTPLIARQAKAVEKVFTEMPVKIRPEELIVGVMPMGTIGFGVIFPDYATEEEKKQAAKKGLTPKSVWGHYVPNYQKILQKGLKGIRKEVYKRLEDNSLSQKQIDFLNSILITLDALGTLARRYSKLAAQKAEEQEDDRRKAELKKISQICSRVPEEAAQTFYEALQSFWFTYTALHSTLNFVPVGRFDQYMYTYLKRDLDSGRLTLDQAQELVDCLWLKFNERVQILEENEYENHFDKGFMNLGGKGFDFEGVPFQANSWLQNVMLGGQTSEGKDATNELTYLCLNATGKFRVIEPVVSTRFHTNSPRNYLKRVCKVIRTGGGLPVVYNDDIIISAYKKMGFNVSDALDYSNDGCTETLFPGRTELRWEPIHSLQCLEFIFTRGYVRGTNERRGIDTGNFFYFKSFDQFMKAFKAQLEYQVIKAMDRVFYYYGDLNEIAPQPFMSSILSNCIANVQDVTEGGADFIFHNLLLSGFSHTVDSLVVIKKLIFEEKKFTLEEFNQILEKNFEGWEELRLTIKNHFSKFGRDDDYADEIAREISEYYAQLVKTKSANPKIHFIPGMYTFEWYVQFGKLVGATPDGRLAYTPIASNISTSVGMDTEGPSSVLNSVSKLNLIEHPSGATVDLSLDPGVVSGERGLERLMAIIKSSLELRGAVLSITVNDVEELKRAQEEPEKYQSLRVRLGGFQAFFVTLNKEHQDQHIARYTNSTLLV